MSPEIPTAERPTNVRIVKPDGREIPCELAYVGIEDGCHQWAVTAEFNPEDGDRIMVAKWPGRTGILFPTRGSNAE